MLFKPEITRVNRTIINVTLAIFLLQACGPSFQVLPLVGEGPEVVSLLNAKDGAKATAETVVVIEHFYRAVNNRKHNSMWALLSSDTRMELDDLADALDTNGKQLLRTRMFPLDDAGDKSMRVSLSTLFLVHKPISFEAKTTPGPADSSAKVIVKNAAGKSRTVNLQRERGEWRIHHTDFSKLPAAVDENPRLLPWDKLTCTNQPPRTAAPTPKKETQKNTAEPKTAPTKKKSDLDF